MKLLNKAEYVKALASIYYTANMADSFDQSQSWQEPADSSNHCNPISLILRDLVPEKDMDRWVEESYNPDYMPECLQEMKVYQRK